MVWLFLCADFLDYIYYRTFFRNPDFIGLQGLYQRYPYSATRINTDFLCFLTWLDFRSAKAPHMRSGLAPPGWNGSVTAFRKKSHAQAKMPWYN